MSHLWNPYRPEVPVDKDGNWKHYASYEHALWEEVTPFFAPLVIDAVRSGRSAKYLILENISENSGLYYPMFVSDLVDFVRHGTVTDGVLTGYWTASKRGQNYGIKRYKQ